jgi:hypothetical protein
MFHNVWFWSAALLKHATPCEKKGVYLSEDLHGGLKKAQKKNPL